MLDAIYAATVNPNLEKQDRHTVRESTDFMPDDYDRPKRARPNVVEQLNRFAGIA